MIEILHVVIRTFPFFAVPKWKHARNHADNRQCQAAFQSFGFLPLLIPVMSIAFR